MRIVLQRVKEASAHIDGREIARIGHGLLLFCGFGNEDAPAAAGRDHPAWRPLRAMLDKLIRLRIFPDADGKMNHDLPGHGGSLLIVSQFTLYADCRKGRRPSFHLACPPEQAQTLYQQFLDEADNLLPGRVAHGIFGADMDIRLVNWGPATLHLDSSTP